MRKGRSLARAALAVLLLFVSPALSKADDRPLSQAQVDLFENDHLKGIVKPAVLEYSFVHRSGVAGDFTDTVTAEIRAVHDDGRKDVWVQFLTGHRALSFGPALGFNGNPLLMYFLEHDVMEMRQATGGAALYFRNRIREAFVDRAEVRPVEVTLDGRSEPRTEIVVTPFRDDPEIGRYPALALKSYPFVLSDAVPGSLYRLSTLVPAAAATTAPLEESMTFVGERQ